MYWFYNDMYFLFLLCIFDFFFISSKNASVFNFKGGFWYQIAYFFMHNFLNNQTKLKKLKITGIFTQHCNTNFWQNRLCYLIELKNEYIFILTFSTLSIIFRFWAERCWWWSYWFYNEMCFFFLCENNKYLIDIMLWFLT